MSKKVRKKEEKENEIFLYQKVIENEENDWGLFSIIPSVNDEEKEPIITITPINEVDNDNHLELSKLPLTEMD